LFVFSYALLSLRIKLKTPSTAGIAQFGTQNVVDKFQQTGEGNRGTIFQGGHANLARTAQDAGDSGNDSGIVQINPFDKVLSNFAENQQLGDNSGDSFAGVLQAGALNLAFNTQEQQKGSQATILQEGFFNVAANDQSGGFKRRGKDKNTAGIIQTGSSNNALNSQSNSKEASASIVQGGDGNKATNLQSKVDPTSASIIQGGSDNVAGNVQTETTDSSSAIAQFGTGNTSVDLQDNVHGSSASVFQDGTKNASVTTQLDGKKR
jgi:hypothetical protein